MTGPDTHPESSEEPNVQPLARRLFIAAILIILTALVCWFLLPRAGVYVPWWVPILAFAIILAAAVARISEPAADDCDEPPDIAGRIR